MFLDELGAPFGITPRSPRCRFHEQVDATRPGNAQQAETKQPAKLAHATIVFPPSGAFGSSDGQPNLIARSQAINALKQEIEIKAELQLANHDHGRCIAPQGDEIAAANLALDLEAKLFEIAFDRQIECALRLHAATGPDRK